MVFHCKYIRDLFATGFRITIFCKKRELSRGDANPSKIKIYETLTN